jgi:hypothetical protein
MPSFTISAGIAECRDVKRLDEGMRESDTALYRAKRAGRNRICEYNRAESDSMCHLSEDWFLALSIDHRDEVGTYFSRPLTSLTTSKLSLSGCER